jgi:hypothetical protein
MKWLGSLTVIEKVSRWYQKNKPKEDWDKWFAWYPVTVGSQSGHYIKVWFGYVERRSFYPWNSWEYREVRQCSSTGRAES